MRARLYGSKVGAVSLMVTVVPATGVGWGARDRRYGCPHDRRGCLEGDHRQRVGHAVCAVETMGRRVDRQGLADTENASHQHRAAGGIPRVVEHRSTRGIHVVGGWVHSYGPTDAVRERGHGSVVCAAGLVDDRQYVGTG